MHFGLATLHDLVGVTAGAKHRNDPLVSPSARGGWTEQRGSVANFAQEVVQGQLPLSVEGLRGQGVEQFGRSAALVSSLNYHLFFLNHVHEFDTDERPLGCLERFEP